MGGGVKSRVLARNRSRTSVGVRTRTGGRVGRGGGAVKESGLRYSVHTVASAVRLNIIVNPLPRTVEADGGRGVADNSRRVSIRRVGR